jgi:hypothetical protein
MEVTMRDLILLPALLLIVSTSILHATIIHVPGDSTTIQGGINGASAGDTVIVAPGTYHEYDIDFLGKAITVMGTDPEDSAVVAATVVDADSLGSVFYFHNGEDSKSVLSGLTIFNGLGTVLYNDKGGGVACDSASPTIEYCSIIGNVAYEGAGIYCLNYSSPVITNNIITGNTALGYGGGISCGWYSSAKISNNIITGCSAGDDGGGAINCWKSSPSITNNILEGCSAGLRGGGISCFDASPTIINNTIIGNSATSRGGGLLFYRSPATLINTIVWDNYAPVGSALHVQTGNNPTVTYSDIENGWSGIGNIDEEPLFVNPSNDDYHLRMDSPCIDAGDPSIFDTCRPPGLGEERSDMGAYGGEENCGWPTEPGIFLFMTPTGTTTIPRGGILDFNTYIQNNRETTVEGDYWLSVMLPGYREILIPEALLNYPNPLHGQVFPSSYVELSNQLFVPTGADTGFYQLIGRIGQYPNGIFDEESFGFQVVE